MKRIQSVLQQLNEGLQATPFIPDVKLRRFLFRVYIRALFPFELWKEVFKLDLECKPFVAQDTKVSFILNEEILTSEKKKHKHKKTPQKEESAPSDMSRTPQSQSRVRF